ncbi:MAG: N-acyl homoserine lactonase family protein [Acidimicrobiales bacterium]
MSRTSTANPASTYEVVAVRYGSRRTVKSDVFLNYAVYGEPDAPIGMDYYFWIVRNDERTILIDCGFDPEVGLRRGRDVLCPPIEALARFDLEPRDIDLLVVTHAHYDHIGNLGELPGTPLLISDAELHFWTEGLGCRSQFSHSTEPLELDHLATAAHGGRVTTFSGVARPFPGIEVHELGGHTPGQCIVVVEAADGTTVVLASDASHYYEELDLDRPFSFVADLPAMYRGFDTLTEMTQRPRHHMVPGHDPAVMARYPRCSGDLADLAVRLG